MDRRLVLPSGGCGKSPRSAIRSPNNQCASKLIPESVAVRAKTNEQQKGMVMHIASGLALVRRDPAQSDAATARTRRMGWPGWLLTPDQADATRARLRKLLPGTILLTVLVLLGALFPILF
jgi:hypothetical protein